MDYRDIAAGLIPAGVSVHSPKRVGGLLAGNALLNDSSPALRDSILRSASEVPLSLNCWLEEKDSIPHSVYFLRQGMVSMVAETPEGTSLEVATIGREGFTGSLALLGSAQAVSRSYVSLEGSAFKVPSDFVRSLFLSSDEFRRLSLSFIQKQTLVTAQLSLCSKLHSADQRLARWLLTARDRTGSNQIRVTQEMLARLLGIHRPSVSLSMGKLARAGLIAKDHGQYNLSDQEGLAGAACLCYSITNALLTSR